MSGTLSVGLPVGLWDKGARVRHAGVRALTGADEEFLLEHSGRVTPARLVTLLLTRCVQQIGSNSPVTVDIARRLVVGDREALLLEIRAVTFGPKLEPLIQCPDCGERLEIELRVDDLRRPLGASLPEWHEHELPDGTRLRFRLPSGADQEDAADLALTNAGAALGLLVERCTGTRNLPPEHVAMLGQAISELDPQAETRLALTCAACGHGFETLFDAASFLFAETGLHARDLLREVHTLAFHYHWSERDILAMPVVRRSRYLSLLASELERVHA